MKPTVAVVALVAAPLLAAGSPAGCGNDKLGGGGDVPITGISGSTGRGTGGANAGTAGGSPPPVGAGGFVNLGTAGAIGTGAAGGVVGTGAFGGAVGTGAAGGDIGGTGGPMPCEPAPPPVCGALCGNGRRDTCPAGTAPACDSVTSTEDCDGADLPYDSCQSAGYFSGALTCGATCTTDFSGCHECVPLDSLLAACGPAPVSNPKVQGFGLAATDSEIGLAFFDDNTTGMAFARLSPTLALTSSAILGGLPTNTRAVAVAAISSGWVVAVCSDYEVYIHAVGADGRAIARTEVMQTDETDQACMSITLAGRPGGGPLLVWQTQTGVNAAVIAADGLSAGATQGLEFSFAFAYYPLRVDAAWIGNAFFVGVPIWDEETNRRTLSLQSVQPDGTVTLVRTLLPGDLQDGPNLVAGTADLRAVYSGLPAGGVAPDDFGVIWQRLTLTGQLAALPVEIAHDSSNYLLSRAVAVGDDTVALVLDGLQGALAVVRVGPDGQIATPMRDIIRQPGLGGSDMVRRGSDLIVGWFSYDYDGQTSLHLARLTP